MSRPSATGSGAGEEPGRDGRLPGHAPGSSGNATRRLRPVDFATGGAGDTCPPDAALHAVLEDLSGPDGRCGGVSDDELIGLLSRWAAVESRAAAAKLSVVRELIRRRPLPGAGVRGDLPEVWQEGTAHEVSGALAISLHAADALLGLAWELSARHPDIGAMLADGTISELKARIITDELRVLDDERARQAAALIRDELAGKTPAQIGRMAARAVVTVDPDGARKRRERAERDDARVRFWREQAGTSAIAAYGLPTDEALAANANVMQRATEYK